MSLVGTRPGARTLTDGRHTLGTPRTGPSLRWWLAGALGGLGALALAACGNTPSITASASNELSGAVSSIRSAALAGNVSLADHDLASLQTKVSQLEILGKLSQARAQAILAAANTVRTEMALVLPKSATTTTSSTTTTTTTAPGTPVPTPGPGGPGGAGGPGGHGPGPGPNGDDNGPGKHVKDPKGA